MRKTNVTASAEPTAFLAVNKSRMKMYNKDEAIPTYYLQKGQEFMIELFNPTKNNILAKIYLNGVIISQSGLVLKPGQRYFLDRYIDIPKKFLFDTYEVSNTEEVRKAIEDNGDFKIEFYRESIPTPIYISNIPTSTYININDFNKPYYQNVFYNRTGDINQYETTITCNNLSNSTTYSSYLNKSEVTLDFLDNSTKSKRSIETGRVEQGSNSSQRFNTVDMNFEFFAFHTIKYKMLPISQKINNEDDLKIKIYCTNCGSKLKPDWKFCPKCSNKI